MAQATPVKAATLTRPRGRGSSKFAHGREASSDKLIRWKFAPLEPDWASKVELGADAVKPIGPTERLVDFWLRVSRPMAKALHQEFEVLNERDTPADISPRQLSMNSSELR